MSFLSSMPTVKLGESPFGMCSQRLAGGTRAINNLFTIRPGGGNDAKIGSSCFVISSPSFLR